MKQYKNEKGTKSQKKWAEKKIRVKSTSKDSLNKKKKGKFREERDTEFACTSQAKDELSIRK